MYFYIDIENYKLHWISIHNHYIYIHRPALKNIDWLRIYEWKPHRAQETINMLRCHSLISRFKHQPVKWTHSNFISSTSIFQRTCLIWSWYAKYADCSESSLVVPVNKGHFGEWVKRQMNYQNKTKNKNKKQRNQTTSHVHSKNSSVSPAGIIISSKQDFNRTYGFTITSIHQLSCSNKYSSLPIDLHFWSVLNNTEKTVTNQKLVIKRTPSISYSKSLLWVKNNQNNTQRAFQSHYLLLANLEENEFRILYKVKNVWKLPNTLVTLIIVK